MDAVAVDAVEQLLGSGEWQLNVQVRSLHCTLSAVHSVHAVIVIVFVVCCVVCCVVSYTHPQTFIDNNCLVFLADGEAGAHHHGQYDVFKVGCGIWVHVLTPSFHQRLVFGFGFGLV